MFVVVPGSRFCGNGRHQIKPINAPFSMAFPGIKITLNAQRFSACNNERMLAQTVATFVLNLIFSKQFRKRFVLEIAAKPEKKKTLDHVNAISSRYRGTINGKVKKFPTFPPSPECLFLHTQPALFVFVSSSSAYLHKASLLSVALLPVPLYTEGAVDVRSVLSLTEAAATASAAVACNSSVAAFGRVTAVEKREREIKKTRLHCKRLMNECPGAFLLTELVARPTDGGCSRAETGANIEANAAEDTLWIHHAVAGTATGNRNSSGQQQEHPANEDDHRHAVPSLLAIHCPWYARAIRRPCSVRCLIRLCFAKISPQVHARNLSQ